MCAKSESVSIIQSSYETIDIESLLEPLGGMRCFVAKDEQVVVKPNLLNASTPDEGVVTHPAVVAAVCKAVLQAGGVPVIGDSPGGLFSKRRLERVYRKAGLTQVSKELGVALNYDTGTTKVEIPGGKRVQKAAVCSFLVDADRIIAVPKIKTHSYMMMTLATKIMFGAVPGLLKAAYHSKHRRRKDFASMLIDILGLIPADLYILDGVIGMQGDGPAGGTVVDLGVLMASTDAVAMDASVCEMLGVEPVGIPVLKEAKLRGLWPSEIRFPLLSPKDVKVTDFQLPSTAGYLLTGEKTPDRVPVITDACVACGDCRRICPVSAILIPDRQAVVDYEKCIRCYCCHEICIYHAVKLQKK